MDRFDYVMCWFYVHTWFRVWSILMNCLFWVRPGNWRRWVYARGAMRRGVRTWAEYQRLAGRMDYRADRTDWQAWVVTSFGRELRIDCEDAAAVHRWALGQLGHRGKMIYLYRRERVDGFPWIKYRGHAVCVSGSHVGSNNWAGVIDENEYPESLLRLFGGEYDIIVRA